MTLPTRKPQGFRIVFTKNTETKFIDPDTGQKEWYGSDYWKGTYLEVEDILSGNMREIRARCFDGMIVVLDTQSVKIET